jgi:hypothetical protein
MRNRKNTLKLSTQFDFLIDFRIVDAFRVYLHNISALYENVFARIFDWEKCFLFGNLYKGKIRDIQF